MKALRAKDLGLARGALPAFRNALHLTPKS
jgi:hypothetical protein